MSNSAASQQGTPNADDFTNGLDMSAIPAGEGADLHYQSIGKRSLSEGDSLMVSVAQNKAAYDRIVEWIVADNRDADGRTVEVNRNGDSAEPRHDQAWDAIRFKNPFPFAMTTGPAMILDGGHFAGQSLSYWVNSGEETTLRVTQALSIRTRATEFEERDNNRETVLIGASMYRKVNVTGHLTVNNHRRQDVSMVIRREFSGDLIKADGDPKTVLREEGVYSVNRRNELVWTIPLKSGEEKTLTYEYAVLIYENPA